MSFTTTIINTLMSLSLKKMRNQMTTLLYHKLKARYESVRNPCFFK